jgi:signal transduction histidine kinase
VSALCLAQIALLDHAVAGDVVALIALYTLVAYGPGPRLAALATACGAAGALLAAVRWDAANDRVSLLGTATSAVASMLLAATLGAWRRSRQAQLAALRERNRLLAVERDQQAAVGAAIERARIARELHDVVAHSLSVIVVQADGAAAGAEQRPAAAAATLRTIGDTGREALGQMRRLLGVLRAGQDAEGPALAPQPGAAELDALVDQVARAGVPARLAVEGRPRPLGGTIDVTVYRVAQEALTNVARHAGARDVTVRLASAGTGLELVVEDAGRGSGAAASHGIGIVGMRERAALVGGTLEIDSRAGAGTTLRLRVPPHLEAATTSRE